VLETHLAVGDATRERAGRVILISLVLTTAFLAVTWWSKETPALDLHQPWQDDPYDVVVSLDLAVLPVLVSIAVLRIQLCRRFSPLPVRRLLDLLRVGEAAVGVCLVTESTEWVAVLLGPHRDAWTEATMWQIASLLALTGAMVVVGTMLTRMTSIVRHAGRAESQPDWLADAVDLGRRASRSLGRRSAGALAALQWIDRRVLPRIRRHPMASAAVLAGVLALPFVIAKAVREGYPPPLLLLSFALPAAGLFAFVVLVGRFLRVVASGEGGPTGGARAVLAACILGPLVFAFHDMLLPHPSALGLNALLFGGAAAGASLSAVAQLIVHRLLPHRDRR
jgi:hypothetical protein